MTPRSRSQESPPPPFEEEWIGGGCRSISPLSKPLKRCKNHRRDEIESKLKKVNNGGRK
jgi:hypothetical protein